MRTGTVFLFSPCIKERNKNPYLKIAHNLYYQHVLYLQKNTLLLSCNFDLCAPGYMIL